MNKYICFIICFLVGVLMFIILRDYCDCDMLEGACCCIKPSKKTPMYACSGGKCISSEVCNPTLGPEENCYKTSNCDSKCSKLYS